MHVNGLTIRRFASGAAAARTLARSIARTLSDRPSSVFGLPTGRTPVALYAELVTLHHRGLVDFAWASTFNLDEFLGVDASAPYSYRSFMERVLFAHVNLNRRRIHFLDGRAPDVERECRRYERAIARAGGIDLMLLGLGVNGHIGFNEPSPVLQQQTHRVTLTAETRRANAELFRGESRGVPREGLSMGMGTILRSRRIVLLATGSAKAAAVRRLVHEGITTRLPASFLQVHPAAEVWVDAAAAAEL